MFLEPGSRILAVHRRLFENDHCRFFIGILDKYDQGIAKVTGHTWIRDIFTGSILKKEDKRTKLISLVSGTLIVYLLDDAADLTSIHFNSTSDGKLWMTDGVDFNMDISETIRPRFHD